MIIRVIRPTQASGRALAPGQVADIPDSDASLLVSMGKAERFVAVPVPVVATATLPRTTTPDIETASIAPQRGATRKKAHK